LLAKAVEALQLLPLLPALKVWQRCILMPRSQPAIFRIGQPVNPVVYIRAHSLQPSQAMFRLTFVLPTGDPPELHVKPSLKAKNLLTLISTLRRSHMQATRTKMLGAQTILWDHGLLWIPDVETPSMNPSVQSKRLLLQLQFKHLPDRAHVVTGSNL
jgi:hypothetical protein